MKFGDDPLEFGSFFYSCRKISKQQDNELRRQISTIYFVTCCSCFSQLSLPVLLYFLYFSVLLLLFKYVKLDNSFYYQALVEVCMFLIIFISIILSVFVWIMYFCQNYRKKDVNHYFLADFSHNVATFNGIFW